VIFGDPPDTAARLKRIEQLIEEFRVAKRRQLLRQAIKLWRKAEASQRLAEFDVPPERVH
jgi:hypothetical protein